MIENLTGQKWGRLTALRFAGWKVSESGNRMSLWEWRCDCGNITKAVASSVKRGLSNSCGCLRSERSSKTHTKHGHTKGRPTRTYTSWGNMIARCYDKNNTAYPNYGAKGRVVCEWFKRFDNFLKDLGECPLGKTIERIENKGNYTCGHCDECKRNNWPANCKWATRGEQSRNTSRTVLITCNGKTQALVDWAKEVGITHESLRDRIKNGWPVELAVTKPKAKRYG